MELANVQGMLSVGSTGMQGLALKNGALAGIASGEAATVDEARRAANEGDDAQAAEAFEAIFARLLVREMRRALPEGPFGGGAGSDVFEGWFDEHLGNALVERDALGLAGLVKTAVGRKLETQTTQATGDSQ